MPAKICVFDLLGTLVDESLLDRVFAEIFDANVRPYWDVRVKHEMLVLNEIGAYVSQPKIAETMLDAIAKEMEVEVADDYRKQYKKLFRELPPFPDVFNGLSKLKEAGFKLVTLSNAPVNAQNAILKHADLARFFDGVYSTDRPKVFKPARASYESLQDELGAEPSDMWFVAAHGWDITGAHAAGFRTALIDRSESAATKFDAKPDLKEKSLDALAPLIADYDHPLLHARDVILAKASELKQKLRPEAKPSED